jgi:hypothetical protein
MRARQCAIGEPDTRGWTYFGRNTYKDIYQHAY